MTGNLGGGKTLGALQWAMEYSLKAGGAPVASNIQLNPDFWGLHRQQNPAFKLTRLVKAEDLVDFVRAGGGVLLLDELHRMADARMSMATANVLLSQFAMFLRKIQVTLIYTTQWERQIDGRLRAVTDILVRARRWKTPEGPRFEYQVFDWQGGRRIGNRTIEPGTALALFAAYDTYEFGVPMRLPSSVAAFDKWMARLEEAAQDARRETTPGPGPGAVPPAVDPGAGAGQDGPGMGTRTSAGSGRAGRRRSGRAAGARRGAELAAEG